MLVTHFSFICPIYAYTYESESIPDFATLSEIDWFGMAKAVAKAIWPFIAGAFGGLFSGCTFGGIGPNFV